MNMLEKVARASFKCWRDRMTELGHHMDRPMNFEDMKKDELEFAFMNAKAMIAAMREPTEEMLKGSFNYTEIPGQHSNINARYQAMINAALKE